MESLGDKKILLFVPTFNERGNVSLLIREVLALPVKLDLLFIDDNSPDGTGGVIEELARQLSNLKVIHRQGKLGIGSAHIEAIRYAYSKGYERLVTMDCDFTHRPSDIPEMLGLSKGCDLVVGSRYLQTTSLSEWNLHRKLLTLAGHTATYFLLGLPYDASGAFRVYSLDRIPEYAFNIIDSPGYSFFFESLHVLHVNGFSIRELAIELPARTYGSSKMSFSEIRRSLGLLFRTAFTRFFNPEKFVIVRPLPEAEIDRSKIDPQGWDFYWKSQKQVGGMLYDAVASLYRKFLIRPALNHALRKHFPPGSVLLHAGCGSGQVDADMRHYAKITGLDISVNALAYYRQSNGEQAKILHGSIFDIQLPDSSVDGVYNLGVMEHFTPLEIVQILQELRRVTRPGGRIVMFWPPENGTSVLFFKTLELLATKIFRKKKVNFHPPELTRVQSREQVNGLLKEAGLVLEDYTFGARDLFTQVVVVASTGAKPAAAEQNSAAA